MTHPTDEELDALVKRAMVIDPLLEVDFDTQRDVVQDPYGAWEAIETALYLIRDQTAAITAQRAQLAEVRHLMHMRHQEMLTADGLMRKHQVRADRAEAALAAQIEEMETCGDCMGSGYGGHPDSGVLCHECGGSGAIRTQPHDRTALDRMLRAEREKALREAAEYVGKASNTFPDNIAWAVEDLANAILTMIEHQ